MLNGSVRHASLALVAAAGLALTAAHANAAMSTYSQNFESLVQSNPGALAADGWKIFANVFSPDHSTYYYGYGVFGAPNGGNGFSAIDVGQGGPSQGAQQLSVYSDYNNGDHAFGNQIEVNVFQEQTVASTDVGSTWTFSFDAKLGNLQAPTTAIAFIKTLDPNAGYMLTNFITVNTSSIPSTWGTYSAQINITPSLAGQIIQFGFSNTASNYVGSGVFYDNINIVPAPAALPAFALGGLLASRRRRA